MHIPRSDPSGSTSVHSFPEPGQSSREVGVATIVGKIFRPLLYPYQCCVCSDRDATSSVRNFADTANGGDLQEMCCARVEGDYTSRRREPKDAHAFIGSSPT